jgi:hypothetical protein
VTLYMHTLDGKPASYFERDGVCFTNRRIKLAKSLRQIRREQAAGRKRREDAGLTNDFTYGYATVSV